MEKKTDSIIKFKPSRAFGSLVAATAVAALMVPSFAFGLTAEEAKTQAITWAETSTQTINGVTGDNVGNTEYWLQLEANELKQMSIDVPMKVYLAVDEQGNFMTPTALKNVIENDSEFPVNVSAMKVSQKNGFILQAASGFAASDTSNIFKGNVSSVALNAAGDDVDSTKQSIAFTKAGTDFAKNTAWSMQASNSVASAPDRGTAADPAEKTGDDCLFIQIDGALANVEGKYFTAPINVFDITYTFEATSADLTAPSGALTD